MVTVSLCMIVKNEAEVLARCLESVRGIADEIIIVDTGSTDETKKIAAGYTDRIYDFEWIDDFAAARNFSFSKAKMDYCMWLDADDVILPENWLAFLELKQLLCADTDVVMLPYQIAFDEAGNPTFSYYRERLIRRQAGLVWCGAVHEAIPPHGKIYYSNAAVSHKKIRSGDPDRNLRIYEKLLAEGKAFEPREQFYYGRELFFHARYREAAEIFRIFLDGDQGWAENKIDACRLLSECYIQLGKTKQAMLVLFESFCFDLPRAETCCMLGSQFLDRSEYRNAIYWYERALSCPRDETSGAFIRPDCYEYIPYIQLCVCYDKLGEYKKAYDYNERAGVIKPESAEYQHNRAYFQQRLHISEEFEA